MKWKKASEELDELLAGKMAPFLYNKRRMFGSPVYFVKGNMLAGVHQDNIFLRLSPRDKEKILSENDEVTPFEPMEGRVMREYVVLPESIFDRDDLLEEWLERSHAFVSSLPPKKPKKKN